MSEERMLILRMLQEGKITSEDAAKLLDAVGERRQAPPPAPAFVDQIKRAVDDVVRTIPPESIDEVKDALRETLREGREAAREMRHWARGGWGHRLATAIHGGHEATSSFEDARATSATRLVVRNTRGDVRLSRSPDGQLRVQARRRAWAPEPGEAERLAGRLPVEVREEGDTVVIEGPGARPFHERMRVDFDIAVPETLNVAVNLVRGAIQADDLARELEVTLVKGDVHVGDCARAAIQAVSGDVIIERSRGDVAVKTTRGDVVVKQAAGDVALSTKRGDVVVGASLARRLAVNTLRGDVAVRVREFAPGGAAAVSTLHGDVTVYLGPAARCRIEASTLSGDVASRLQLLESSRDRGRLTGVLNAPDATLRASTTHGDVSLLPLESDASAPQAPPA